MSAYTLITHIDMRIHVISSEQLDQDRLTYTALCRRLVWNASARGELPSPPVEGWPYCETCQAFTSPCAVCIAHETLCDVRAVDAVAREEIPKKSQNPQMVGRAAKTT